MSELPPPPPPLPRIPQEPPGRADRVVRWTLAAVALVIFGSAIIAGLGTLFDRDPSTSADPSVSHGARPPDPVERLRSHAGAFVVKLSWRPGVGEGAVVDRYDIQRSGYVLAHLAADQTSWVDDSVAPGQVYSYLVIAVGDDGSRSSEPIDVETRSAPPGKAPLLGTFTVKVDATSNNGFTSLGSEHYRTGWRFVPACAQPPCNTRMRDVNKQGFVIELRRSEGRYTGSAVVPSSVRCGSSMLSSTYSVTIHVMKATVVRDRWLVTAFTGTMRQEAMPQSGCMAASADFAVAGRRFTR